MALISLRSIRARPRRARSFSTPSSIRSRARSRNSGRFIRRRAMVEHDPEEIWSSVLATAQERDGEGGPCGEGHCRHRHHQSARDRDRLGSRNRQAAAQCHRLAGSPHRGSLRVAQSAATRAPAISARTGLLLDPYFSATKIAWILDHVAGAREAAKAGRLAFGTVDTFLLWRLTEGRVHATDATNAARTLLFDINSAKWHPEHSELFRVPANMLPEVRDCAADFGTTDCARRIRSEFSASRATSRRRPSGRAVFRPA